MKSVKILENLFLKRENEYIENTNKILTEIEDCIYAVELLFEGVMDNFIWLDIEYDMENNVILLITNAKYKNSIIEVKTNNDIIKVSTVDKNGKSIRKEIIIGIPLELILSSNYRDIYTYLVDMEARKDSPMFTIENNNKHQIILDGDPIFSELYQEIENKKNRIIH